MYTSCLVFMFHPLKDNHLNRRVHGQLSTKTEFGEDTIPIKNPLEIQTWNALLSGTGLLTMSCSDKIAKWNVLGIQGKQPDSVLDLLSCF